MESLFWLLVALIVIGILAGLLFKALASIPMPEWVRGTLVILIALVILVVIVQEFGLLRGLR